MPVFERRCGCLASPARLIAAHVALAGGNFAAFGGALEGRFVWQLDLIPHLHPHLAHSLLDLGTHRVLVLHGESCQLHRLFVLDERFAPARHELKLDG